MASIYFYYSQFCKFVWGKFQILLQEHTYFPRQFHIAHNDVVFQKLARRLVYDYHSFRLLLVYLYEICHLHCLDEFPKTNDWDYNTVYYHNDGELIDLLEYLQRTIHRICGAAVNSYHINRQVRIHLGNKRQSKSSIAFHCKILENYFYLHAPRIYQFVFVLDLAYQHLLLGVGHLPGVHARGHLIFNNYIMGTL